MRIRIEKESARRRMTMTLLCIIQRIKKKEKIRERKKREKREKRERKRHGLWRTFKSCHQVKEQSMCANLPQH